ncbi:MAG: hypothetical protein H6Q03_1303 [Acidobacteria bacterium]|jgi:hypothetical protein|nr:hypothetical protein [Acidobacteriota bacterium]
MDDILGLLGQKLDARTIQTLAGQIGAAPQQTRAAVETAVPLLLGALQRNAAAPQGAASLLGALDRDHDGSVLDNVAGFFGQAPTGADLRSVEHIFGARRGGVESAVARASGLDSGQVMQLLAQLAPLLLGLLGRARKTTGADAGGLGDLLGGAMGRMQQSNPGLGGLLGGLLDADGDGSSVDDLLGQALGGGGSAGGSLGGLLGGLLGGKR